MQLFFAGAESQAHLDTLRSCGVTRVALSISNLARHTRDYTTWAVKNPLKGFDWLVYADSPTVPVAPLLEILSAIQTEPEAVIGPAEWATDTWLNDSDILFLPIWDGLDPGELRFFVESYDGVVLTDAVVDNPSAVRTAKAAMNRMSVLGALTGRSKAIHTFDMLVSSAWYAVQKHGETQVWTGNRLVRLNADDKHLKRARYAEAIEGLGANLSAVLNDDSKETSRLAVLSWLAYEGFLTTQTANGVIAPAEDYPRQGGPLVTSTHPAATPQPVPALGQVASAPPQTRHESTQVLPVIDPETYPVAYTDENGQQQVTEHFDIASSAESMRQCDTCKLSAACPGFSPHSRCSYNIPVVIRTKDQRHALMRTLVEIQAQRVLMGTFAEQVEGQQDDQVGKEMDRLFQMVERWKTIEEETQKFHIGVTATASGQDANLGMISRLFGSQAGQNARVLDVPVSSDQVMEDLGASQ